MKFSNAAAAIVAAALVTGIGAASGIASAQTLSNPGPDFNPQAAAAYCTSVGGRVETRTAVYGTN